MPLSRAAVASLALAGAAATAAGEPGQVVRVPAPRRLEVFVPAGGFVMGVDDDAALAAVQQCELAYPALTGTHPATGKPVGFCSVDYEADLVHMRQRNVTLDGYAIDRDEVSVSDYRACVAAGGCDLDPLISGDERYIHDAWPLVNVTWLEAGDYCRWRGARLPTEAEWEHAARGGLHQATYPWGDDFTPRGKIMANTWHGQFPHENLALHGFTRTSPVKRFPPNGYGLFDVAGNVWEWTATRWTDTHADAPDAPSCCGPAGLAEHDRYVTKGGSHLCAPSYCHRYRPAARQGHAVRSSTTHLGFRCVRRLSSDAEGRDGH
jgi:formylglycine-generating enzyme required for sulfatase activity